MALLSPGARLPLLERTDPYHPNLPAHYAADGTVLVLPGALATLTSVPPPDWSGNR